MGGWKGVVILAQPGSGGSVGTRGPEHQPHTNGQNEQKGRSVVTFNPSSQEVEASLFELSEFKASQEHQ